MTTLRRLITLVCLLTICLQATLSSARADMGIEGGPGTGDTRPPAGLAPQTQSVLAPSTTADDTHFVADTGGDLDQYLFRTDRPDGKLKFSIQIKRYFFNKDDTDIMFDSSGFLTANAVSHAVSKKILPANLKLRLRVYDVDEDAAWCPEKDLIFINGQALNVNGHQAQLSGANDSWSERSFDVPIGQIKFPQHKGSSSSPIPADNEIAIRVDASNCDAGGNPAWAVQVDFGVLEVSGALRPVVFAHGWTGATSTFNKIEERMKTDGVPSAGQVDLQQGIYPISTTADWLSAHIKKSAQEFGVDKVNVFAHSKGGLVSRRSLNDPNIAKLVEHLVTFDTPNHGTTFAVSGGIPICLYKYASDSTRRDLCIEATKELTEDSVRENFNYSGCTKSFLGGWKDCKAIYVQQSGVDYRAFAATKEPVVYPHESAGFPWFDDQKPMPSSMHVDASYDDGHGGILGRMDSYQCAIHLLDNGRYSCPGTNALAASQAVTASLTASQPIFNKPDSLAGAGQATESISVDAAAQLQMEVFSASELSFSLHEPGGRLIDPSVAEVDANIQYSSDMDLGVYHYSYVIDNPISGAWDAIVQSNAAAVFTTLAQVDSPVTLELSKDQSTYIPGQTITVQAVLLQSGSYLKGETITGEFEQPDHTLVPVSFYDDQTHGDATALDGIYTAQFTAPDTQAHLNLRAIASQGLTRREQSTLITVSNQTAAIGNVSSEWTTDDNGDGFIDWLNIQVNINVLKSGYFDLQGSLSDNSSAVLLSSQFQSREQTALQLDPGLHSVVLQFSGDSLWAAGKDGPYTLTNLILQDTTNQIYQVDSATNTYTTAPYTRNQFNHASMWLESSSASAVDQNANGRYDALIFHLQVGIETPGDYEMNGRLLDKDGNELMWNQASFSVSSAGLQPVDFSFDGSKIGQLQAQGPYTLTDISISNTQGAPSLYLGKVMTTVAYQFTQFEEGFYRTYLPSIVNKFNQAQGVKPILFSPSNGVTLNTLIPTLSWTVGTQPTGSGGCLAISQSIDPTNCMMGFGTGYTGTWTEVMWYNLQPNMVYYWRVGVSPNGQSPYLWSEQRSFKTGPAGGTIPSAPTLIAPADNAVIPTSSLVLSWQPVSGALGYSVSVHDITRNSWYGFSMDGTITQVTLSSYFLKASTGYEWNVSARNDYAWGAASVSRKFSTAVTLNMGSFEMPPDFQRNESQQPVYLEP